MAAQTVAYSSTAPFFLFPKTRYMTSYLHGIHDVDEAELMSDRPGWIVATVAIGYDPADHSGANFYAWTSRGYGVIVRLNNGYGSTGTIPTVEHYEQFAARCANFVGASPGVYRVIIGNEPNHANERPGGVYITPEQYARCFTMCRNAIKGVSVQIQVMPAAIAPYHADGMDCMEYWRKMLERIKANGSCDGIILHAYTRSSNPADITSTAMMGPPLEGQYSGFLTYQNQADIATANGFGGLPAYITEFNELLDHGWDDANTGVVQAAYREINEWNLGGEAPKIHALCLYRSNHDDKWSFADKNGVKDDFRQAVSAGYTVASTPTPPTPTPEPPEPEPARDIDPRLYERGVTFDFASVPAGTAYWRIVKAYWLDEDEADTVGPDHHMLGTVVRDGQEVGGVLLRVDWPGGGVASVVSKVNDPNAIYNWNYPMSSSLNEFSVQVYDGAPSDKASGIGMGKDGNPSIHTSTWIDFLWTISEGPETPIPPPLPRAEILVWPVVGAITQHFGEGPAQFGQQGHNGIDIAVVEGTPVAAIADGEVMFTGFDQSYGNYVRCYHPAIHSHSFYAHLASIDCSPGELVKQGAWIGHSGNTGNSTGPHLHFELRAGSRDAYYEHVTYGYSKGRYNPTDAYVVTGSPLMPGAGL
jgi:hypothetical protein